MKPLVVRSVLFAALSLSVTAAQAVEVFSNKPSGNYYGNGPAVFSTQDMGYRFASSASVSIESIDVAMTNLVGNTPSSFTLELYSDSGGSQGSLLGSFSGMTDGSYYTTSTSYATVAASSVSLVSGTSYWLVAKSSNLLIWNWVDHSVVNLPYLYGTSPNYTYGYGSASAFSVSVAASVVPGRWRRCRSRC